MAFSFNKLITPPLFFLFLSFISLGHSLSTISISETSNQTLVCALVPSPNTQQQQQQQPPFLNCTSFRIPLNPNISFSGIVSGDGFLCALTTFPSISKSTMVCWRFSANGTNMSYKRIYQGQSLAELEAGNSHICGLSNHTNRLACWQWPEFNYTSIGVNFTSLAVGEDFVCGLSALGKISCFGGNANVTSEVPTGNYSVISAGFWHACALNLSNDLTCWGSVVWEVPQGKFRSLAIGENRGCALRDNETVVCWGQNNFSVPDSLSQSYFSSIVAKRNVICGVLKVNFSLYCWDGGNFNSDSPVFDLVLPGPCRSSSSCPCGPIAASGIYCTSGYSICQHCPSSISPAAPAPFSPNPTPQSPPSPSAQGGSRNSEWNGKMTAFLVVGCVGSVAFLLVIGFFLFRYCKCRGYRVHDSGPLDESGTPQQQGSPQPGSSQQQTPPDQAEQSSQTPVLEKRLSQLASIGNVGNLEEFSFEVLMQATNNFSEDCKIGTGSFGSVYHGTLEGEREVAIKRAEASISSPLAVGPRCQEDKDHAFINELESLSRIHHKNLVQLLGFCEDSNELVLVYEYMENGTLHDHLHSLENSHLQSWPARIKVALDAARGIEYLHQYAVPPIIHRDIKSSNILLDSTWTAKVSDFGLSLMGPQDEDSHLSLRAAGTVGYMDPEYYRLQQLTTKSDVYSFGVLLLEMLSGHKAIHKNENGVPRNVVDVVVPHIFQDQIHRVLDPRVPPPNPFEIDAVAYVGYLAADCVTLEGRDRPSMTDIVNSLDRALAACLVRPTSLSRSTTESTE